MAYNIHLADRVRDYLFRSTDKPVEEKKMFGGLAFMVDGKMCICVSGENLMCRFERKLTDEALNREGVLPMIMRGKRLQGYCYVEPMGYEAEEDFRAWMNRCLDFNDRAKSSY